jgi:hypothetical protein
MTWYACREIRVREHTAKGRPGSRPCLIIAYIDGHADVFDFRAFESDKQFAREKAGSRWLELQGEAPVPLDTAKALARRFPSLPP